MKRDTTRRPTWLKGGAVGRSGRVAAAAAVFVFVALCPMTAAMAQQRYTVPGEDGGVLQWVIGVGLALLIGASGFLNSKRTHLN